MSVINYICKITVLSRFFFCPSLNQTDVKLEDSMSVDIILNADYSTHSLNHSDTLTYHIGDRVTFTCQQNYAKKYCLSWKQNGDVSVSYPPSDVKNNALAVTLDSFDDGSEWSCTVFEDCGLKTPINKINFTTTVVPNMHMEREYFNKLTVSNQCSYGEIEGRRYKFINNQTVNLKIITSDYDFCILTIPGHKLGEYSRDVTYKRKPESSIETNTVTIATTTVTIATEIFTTEQPYTTDTTEDNTEDRDPDASKLKITIGAGILLIIIPIAIFTAVRAWRKRRKSTLETEGFYATTNDIVYAEIMVSESGASAAPTRNDIPYAQVIGVVIPKRQRKT